MTDKIEIMIDIEALGLVPGSAIIEIGAVKFLPSTGVILDSFGIEVAPQAPFTADLDTLAWHREQGSYPRASEDESHAIGSALYELGKWIGDVPKETRFWSWGATYDFPILQAAYTFAGEPCPWKYWQAHCARTVWNLAFPGKRHSNRPHIAVQDAIMAVADLTEATVELEV